MAIITLRQIEDNFYKIETDLNVAVKSVVFSKYIYPLQRYDYDNQRYFWGFGYCMTNLFNSDSWCSDTSNGNWIGSDLPSELFAYINNHFYNSEVYGSGNRGIHFLFPAIIQINTNYTSAVFGALPNYSDVFDDKGLYSELLDNEETKLSLQDWIDDDGTHRWDTLTDNDLKAMELIEKYNKNVLLLRSTRKVNIENTVSTASTSSSSVNLSGVENKLQNINNSLNTLNGKLEVEEQVDGDVEIKSLTQVVKDLDLSNQTVITTVENAPYNPLLDDGSEFL